MRTTLEIEDELLDAVKDLAQKEGRTVGAMISALARQGLQARTAVTPAVRNGVPLFAPRSSRSAAIGRPDLSLVNRLRDEP